jgi:segregation and condensation protein A
MEYNFTINDFEGPLDLLLHLVKSAKLDIYSINIKDLIDEYLDFINSMDKLNIDVTSEYLVMAAELIHLKSKMLINKTDEEEDTEDYSINTEEDLRNKLVEYEKIKNITSSFKDLALNRQQIYEKSPENYHEFVDKPLYQETESDINTLYEAILEFQHRLKLQQPLKTKITKKEINIEDRKRDIRNILDKKGKVNFLDLFEEVSKEYIIVTFLSILDMSKSDEILIEQEANFKPIIIEKRCLNG